MASGTTTDAYECWDCGSEFDGEYHDQLCPDCGGYLRSVSRAEPDLR